MGFWARKIDVEIFLKVKWLIESLQEKMLFKKLECNCVDEIQIVL